MSHYRSLISLITYTKFVEETLNHQKHKYYGETNQAQWNVYSNSDHYGSQGMATPIFAAQYCQGLTNELAPYQNNAGSRSFESSYD